MFGALNNCSAKFYSEKILTRLSFLCPPNLDIAGEGSDAFYMSKLMWEAGKWEKDREDWNSKPTYLEVNSIFLKINGTSEYCSWSPAVTNKNI